jgi:hypothetical protein
MSKAIFYHRPSRASTHEADRGNGRSTDLGSASAPPQKIGAIALRGDRFSHKIIFPTPFGSGR